MAFNPANKQLTYGGTSQAKCTLCGAGVAWYRPKGSEVWCGVVSMSDVTEQEMEAHTNPTTGKVSHRIVAVAVQPGSSLHACHPCNQKYTDVHMAAKTGTLKAKTRPEGAPAYRGPRRKRKTSVVTAPAPSTVPYVPPPPTPHTVVIPDTRAVVVPKPLLKMKASALPDPALPPLAEKAWTRAHSLLTQTPINRIHLWGPPGTGKSSFGHNVAEQLGVTVYAITLTEETPGTDLVGRFFLKGGDGVWLDGVATRAMRESHNGPVFLVLDEIDRASGDAMSRCIEILNDPRILKVYLPTGEVVQPKIENWRVIATSNAEPSALIPAVMDRLHASVLLTHPHPGIIASLFSREAKLLLTAASREYSVRSIMSWDRLMRDGMDMKTAAELVFEPDAASALLDAARLMGSGS